MEVVNKMLKLSGILGIFSLCCIGFSGLKYIKAGRSYISVNGLADRIIKSDEATLALSFNLEGNKLSDVKTSLSSTSVEVINFLHKYGFTDEEVVTTNDEITDRIADRYARYGNNSSEKPENRYSITRTIHVKTKKVDAARQLSSHLVDLYEKDICVNINSKFSTSDFSKIRLELLSDAVNDAKLRAQKIADASGTKIRGVREISTGRFIILDADTTSTYEWSDGERSYMKRYRIVINASFDRV